MTIPEAAKKKDSILLFLSDYEAIKDMPNEDFGKLMRAIFEFHLRGAEPDDLKLIYAFKLLNSKIIRANKAYQKICEERSIAGRRGNQKRWGSPKSPTVAKLADGESESDDITKIKKIFLFGKLICPVQQEFVRFWQHYEKNDWVDGNGVAITNKLACAHNWKPEASVGRLDIRSAKAWEVIYNILKDREKSELMVTDLFGFKLKNNTLIIQCTKQLYEFVESNIDDGVGAAIRKEFNCQKIEYETVTR